MFYAQARNRIRSGDLLAWSGRGWSSWADWQIQAIRIFGRTEYSHVGVAWVIAGRVFVIEAVGAGVRIYPLSRAAPFYWLPLGAAWTQGVETLALERVGDRYSKWDAVRAFFGALPIGSDSRWECAELTLVILRAAGVDLGARAVPSDLVEQALRRGAPCYLVEGCA